MKSMLFFFTFLSLTSLCKAQNEDRIYSFMNDELPPLELGKSSWGIFTLNQPVVLDSENYQQILESNLKNVPPRIQQELYQKCMGSGCWLAKQVSLESKKIDAYYCGGGYPSQSILLDDFRISLEPGKY